MGHSSRKYARKNEERPWKVHPIWRGIGCFMAIIMPLMAWAGAELFLQTNTWVPLPPELSQRVLIPLSKQGTIDAVSSSINSFLSGLEVTYGKIFFTFVFLFLGYGVLSILYSIMYRIVGPPRYSELDARPMPAPKRRRY
jgi:hypothetical protein